MRFLDLLPQRLDAGATPTFAGILAGDGTAASPSISFLSDPDTGIYRAAANSVGIAGGGLSLLSIALNGTSCRVNGQGGTGAYLDFGVGGNFSVTAGGTNQNITLTPSGTGAVFSTAPLILKASYVDSGNGKIQLDTHTTSAGGIGFGTGSSIFTSAVGEWVFSAPNNGAYIRPQASATSSAGLIIRAGAVDAYVTVAGTTNANVTGSVAGDLVFRTATRAMLFSVDGGTSSALTIDSSKNSIFGGTIKPQLATTAGAPAYVKGAIYFDTTLNKLRVGGASAWETITSA